MIVGFTGTRNGMTEQQRETFAQIILDLAPTEFHHGDCIGADADAHTLCVGNVERIVGHIPSNDSQRAFCEFHETRTPAPYLVRNRAIVNGCDILVACPKEFTEQQRGGTWYTVRFAKSVGRKLIVILPDGNAYDWQD